MKYTLLLVFTFISPLLYAQDAEQRMHLAARKLRQNDTLAALAYYEQAERLEPRNAEVYATRGNLYMDMKRYKEAKADFDKAILLAPKEPRLYNSRALLFNIAGYNEYTIKDADKAIELSTDNKKEKAFAYYIRAEAKLKSGNPEAALADYGLSIENSPEEDATGALMASLISSANVLGNLGRHKEAIARLETLVEKYPDFTPGYNNLAFEYTEDGQYKKAIEIYDRVIKDIDGRGKDNYTLESGNQITNDFKEKAAPLNNRGFAKFKMGDNKAALKDINASLEIDAENSFAYKNRALVYIATKKQKEACADLRKALDLGFTNTYGSEVQSLADEHCK